ncbi:MAG: peptide deformylase [Myxococcota bacterium]|nr:peptide deformylase [Myxococcota bacterium]
MAILKILEAPHPILEKKAREVRTDEFGPDLVEKISDMVETMYDAPGVGLAAPQVGDPRRIIVADPGNDEGKAIRKLYRMVNPKIIEFSKDKIPYDESCLSVPTFSLKVQRHRRVHIEWKDGLGNSFSEWFEGFPAIVIQHEMDHLVGVTLLDRASRFKKSRYIARRKKVRS